MQNKKALRIIILAILGISLAVAVFYFVTVSLSGPVNQPMVEEKLQKAVEADYENCVILYPEKPVFIASGKTDSLTPGQMIAYASQHRQVLQNKQFSIIITPQTPQPLITLTLEACSAAGISNYRILQQ